MYSYNVDNLLSPRQHNLIREQIPRLEQIHFSHEKFARPVPFQCQPYHIETLKRLQAGHKHQIIIKGRQVYFTTFTVALMFDLAISIPQFSCAIHNMTEQDVKTTIQSKIHYAATNSPILQGHFNAKGLTNDGIVFKNGSSITAQRSGRSHTHYFNLITEAAITANNYPDKFDELLEGMGEGSQHYILFMETSPYGISNRFIDECRHSVELFHSQRLKSTDYLLNFIAWHRKPGNVMPEHDLEKMTVDKDMNDYFDFVEKEENTTLTHAQRCWYVSRLHDKFRSNRTRMRAEHPSTVEEALSNQAELFVLAEQMAEADQEKRIYRMNQNLRTPVVAAWDFGAGKSETAVMLFQEDPDRPRNYRVVFSMQEKNARLEHFFHTLNATGWTIARHLLPHDAEHNNLVAAKHAGELETTIAMLFEQSGVFNFETLPRVKNKMAGFECAQEFCRRVEFCAYRAGSAIESLTRVQKKNDPKKEFIFEKLTDLPKISAYNHLYDCFELAARADMPEHNMLTALWYDNLTPQQRRYREERKDWVQKQLKSDGVVL